MCTAILCDRTINSCFFLENNRSISDQTKWADTLTPPFNSEVFVLSDSLFHQSVYNRKK